MVMRASLSKLLAVLKSVMTSTTASQPSRKYGLQVPMVANL